MPRWVLASLGLSLSMATLGPVPSFATDLHELEGSWARYHVAADSVSLPRVDTLILSTPLVQATPDGDALWFQVEATWQRTRVFALALLVSDLSFLEEAGSPPVVHRYVLFPERGEPLEYVDRATGEAYLPQFGLFDGLLPSAPSGAAVPFFELAEFLGRPLELERAASVGARMLSDLAGHRILELDDRVLIASSRHFRDDGTGRQIDYQFHPPQLTDYRYVPLEKADYEDMIEAGFNLFRVLPEQLDHVLAAPVFFVLFEGTAGLPDLLYRSNYHGCVMYMDEPDVRVARQMFFGDIVAPEVAANAVADYTEETLLGDTEYGSRFLARRLAGEGWCFGPRVDVSEPAIPSWLAYSGTGWYQKEGGARGLINESRIAPAEYSASVQTRLGVDFPAEAEPWIRFELGMTIGATQRYGGDWGVSVFGQMDAAAADLLFPLAYERGARFFWLWTSAKEHHVPHERQLEIVRNFRGWLEGEPANRPRQTRPLVAVALPWGYNCDRSNFKGEDPGFLWWRSQIRLDEVNPSGAEYRDVLAAVYRTFLERIDAGEEVDLVYLRPGESFPGGGYDALYRVLPGGDIQVGITGGPVVTRSARLPLDARPNPFREGTSLRFEVGRGAVTRLTVHDATGRLVRTMLPESRLEAGDYAYWWNGRDDAGTRVSSGVYFVRALVGSAETTRKITLLR